MRETDSHVTKHTKYFNSCNADYLYTAEFATLSLTVLLLKTHERNNKRAKFVNAELSRTSCTRVFGN